MKVISELYKRTDISSACQMNCIHIKLSLTKRINAKSSIVQEIKMEEIPINFISKNENYILLSDGQIFFVKED